MSEDRPKPAPWALLTGLAGVVALAVTLAFGQLPAVKAAGPCFVDGAVVRFEMATTLQELNDIFHPAADPCRTPSIAAMDQSNFLDVIAYIPSYTAFTVLAVFFLSGGRPRSRLALAALAAAIAALAADYVETTTLLKITKDFDAGAALMARSSAACWIKFGALAFHALLLAALCLTQAPRRQILGALLVLPAAGYVAMWLDHERHGLLTLTFVAAWVPLMAMGLWEGIRRRRPV